MPICRNCGFDFICEETSFVFPLSQEIKQQIEARIIESQKPIFVTNKEILLNYGEWSETVSFSGWLKSGVPIEKGRYVYETGDQYEGDFYDDGLPRNGKIVYTNGDVFEGEFSDGEISKGMYKNKDGDLYIGTFTDEDISYGKVTYANGYKYEGAFVNWMPQGRGTFDWGDGRSYTGELYGGVPHGEGSLTDLNKNLIVTGQFFVGRPKGIYQIRVLSDNEHQKRDLQ